MARCDTVRSIRVGSDSLWRHPRQVGPLPAQLEGRDEEIEVVHVGEVVEHEAERDAGLLGDRLGRRIGVAVAEQLAQGVGHVAPGTLASGHASVAGGLVGPQRRVLGFVRSEFEGGDVVVHGLFVRALAAVVVTFLGHAGHLESAGLATCTGVHAGTPEGFFGSAPAGAPGGPGTLI